MEAKKDEQRSRSFFDFPRSIQGRLPLLIFALLLIVVVLFCITSYIGVKNTSLKLGRERLSALSLQLSSMLEQSGKTLATMTRTTAKENEVVNFVASGGGIPPAPLKTILDKLNQDTLSAAVIILDRSYKTLYASGKTELMSRFPIDSLLARATAPPDYGALGKIVSIGDSMYFPVIAGTVQGNHCNGFVVRWRRVLSNKNAIEQLSALLGTKATIYLANNDGKFWTDMIRPVPAPPLQKMDPQQTFTYTRGENAHVMAAIRPIINTPWMVLVEISRDMVIQGANEFLYWIMVMGALLIVAGSLAGWRMSRGITRPLHSLTKAATGIAAGDYSLNVPVERRDEVGVLARSFNSMMTQIRADQDLLESKVKQRTEQLEYANRELEAFSYSVSHDLRAPLRAVSGYAYMMKEDYGANLDPEGNRILDNIVSNAARMGNLIDDLISFSRIGRKEVSEQQVDMKGLVDSCLSEMESLNGAEIKIGEMPLCYGDPSLLKQVWTNLIGNAVKYSSKRDHPEIEIGYRAGDDQEAYFIKDNGVGFDMKYAHKLFGVFQRLHSNTEFEGTGIGLALVHRIISKHGGRIWAQAAQGAGATFLFSIPNTNNHELTGS